MFVFYVRNYGVVFAFYCLCDSFFIFSFYSPRNLYFQVYCLRLCPLLELPYLMLANPAFCTNLKETSKLVEGLTCNLFCPKYYRTSFDITKTTCLSNGSWTRIPHRCLRKIHKLLVFVYFQ